MQVSPNGDRSATPRRLPRTGFTSRQLDGEASAGVRLVRGVDGIGEFAAAAHPIAVAADIDEVAIT